MLSCPDRVQAQGSISKYGVHSVVANILETRKEIVYIVHPGAKNGGAAQVDEVLRGPEQFIEAPLVAKVVQLHKTYLDGEQ